MKNKKVNNGQDYAKSLIDVLIGLEEDMPVEERMDSKLFEYWCDEIKAFADETWRKYITGKRRDYRFNDEEVHQLYEKAGTRFVSDAITSLVDKDMVNIGVNKSGDLVYSLTDKGREYAKQEKQ